ncbi:MAG TPA: hypothetical protein VNA69_06675 [Thermoanaerobaculia bacterium]|nr:hypothetical protein [Thermoanaerobaculia bacterium]
MSLRIECVVATLNPQAEQLAQPFRLAEKGIEDYFAEASGGDIELTMNYAGVDAPLQTGAGAEPFDLNFVLDDLLNNVDAPATKIALILADYWPGHDLTFGLMFDVGFDASIGAMRLPREGAAVFLSSIRSNRANDDDVVLEAMFTAIHELGHVFNLGHLEPPPTNLMSSSQLDEPYRDGYDFTEEQRFLLRHCSTEAGVFPGGYPYGTLGGLVPVGDYSVQNRAGDPRPFGLELVVNMDQREFFHFEPVQLDVCLRVMRGVDREFLVPDCMDPGYDAFDVWIEDPHGERRRYRPPNRYCFPRRERLVTPRESIQRDISIFGQGGGYTFRDAGVHTIWAKLSLGGQPLESNRIEVNVLPRILAISKMAAFSETLLNPIHADLLFYRARQLASNETVGSLEEFIARFHDCAASAHVHYALGRSLIARGMSSGTRDKTVVRRGVEHLRRAHDHNRTSPHERKRAAEVIRDTERQA